MRPRIIKQRLVDGREERHALRPRANAVFGEPAGDSWVSPTRRAGSMIDGDPFALFGGGWWGFVVQLEDTGAPGVVVMVCRGFASGAGSGEGDWNRERSFCRSRRATSFEADWRLSRAEGEEGGESGLTSDISTSRLGAATERWPPRSMALRRPSACWGSSGKGLVGDRNGAVMAARLTACLSAGFDIEGVFGDVGGDSSEEEDMLGTARAVRGYRVRGAMSVKVTE